eukprot:evm.model.scf_714EXC.7 EVM.evm.TU.scf_714EXC.7   scf_714EXC:47239-61229(-)
MSRTPPPEGRQGGADGEGPAAPPPSPGQEGRNADARCEGAVSEADSGEAGGGPGGSRRAGVAHQPGRYRESAESDFGSSEGEDGADIEDTNEEFCTVCGTAENPSKLLCCDNCPKVYHLGCLDPPLSRVPSGDWYCPSCASSFKLQDIEKILAVRPIDKDKNDGIGERELHVKWKGVSYLHCTWVPEKDVAQVHKLFPSLRSRYKAFLKEGPRVDPDVDPDELVDGVNKRWLRVERALSKADTKKGKKPEYFVKFEGLGYDECYWEWVDDIPQDVIREFEQQTSIVEEAQERLDSRQSGSRGGPKKKKSKLKRDLKEDGKLEAERLFSTTPEFLKGGRLHPYQLEGLNWLYFKWQVKENVILADEMGLGKTIQSIAFLATLWHVGVGKPCLVVVPLSTMRNWEREFQVWAPQLRVVSLYGNQETRNTVIKYELFAPNNKTGEERAKAKTRAGLQARVKFHVLLTSYELAIAESTHLAKVDYECLIVDEGHRLKSKNSKLHQELHGFAFAYRVLLTGTPLQNNLAELFMLLRFLDSTKFDSLEDFQQQFADIGDEKQVGTLHEMLSPHLLRRLKKDVLKELPPKKEQIVRVEMSPVQKEVYKSILTKSFKVLTAGKAGKATALKNVMMQLRKCCNHPYVFEGIEPIIWDPEEFMKKFVEASGKLDLLDKMVHRLKEQGHRILIYSQFTMMLDLLEEWVSARKYGHLRIDGAVSGTERQARIDKFNNEQEKYCVFLLSTRAGGLGINLATADTVIIYDSDWNPHNDIQAQSRAHRLGQQKGVMIYRLVTRATIEERMMQQSKKKLLLEHLVVRKMNRGDLKQEELDDILRYGAKELFMEDTKDDKDGDKEPSPQGQPQEPARVIDIEAARAERAERSGRIVYDSAAIDRLLDRSELYNQKEEEEASDNEIEFMKGFTVANFEFEEVSEHDSAQQGAENGEEAVVSKDDTTNDDFWDKCLKNRYEEMKMLEKEQEMATLGRGMRERRDVNYSTKNTAMYVEMSSGDESSESEFHADGKPRKMRKRKHLHDREPPRWSPEPSKRIRTNYGDMGPPVAVVPQQIMTGSGPNLRVLGFNAQDRLTFLNLLLRYGLPEGWMEGGRVNWDPFTSRFTKRYCADIDSYARIVLEHAHYAHKGEVPQSEVLFKVSPQDVQSRLGMLHLFRSKLRQLTSQAWHSFVLKAGPNSKLRATKHWSLHHDWALLQGVAKHGYGRWQDILKDPDLKLMKPLCDQLNVEVERQKADGEQNDQQNENPLEDGKEGQQGPDAPAEGGLKDGKGGGKREERASGKQGSVEVIELDLGSTDESNEKKEPSGDEAENAKRPRIESSNSGKVDLDGVVKAEAPERASGPVVEGGKDIGPSMQDGGTQQVDAAQVHSYLGKHFDQKCRHFITVRLKVIAEVLQHEQGDGRAANPARQPPSAQRQVAQRKPVAQAAQGAAVTRLANTQRPTHTQQGSAGPVALLTGLPIARQYPGPTPNHANARVNLIHMYNTVCNLCKQIHQDATAVSTTHTQHPQQAEEALIRAGHKFRKQLQDLEMWCVQLMRCLPPGRQLPPVAPTRPQSTPVPLARPRYASSQAPPAHTPSGQHQQQQRQQQQQQQQRRQQQQQQQPQQPQQQQPQTHATQPVVLPGRPVAAVSTAARVGSSNADRNVAGVPAGAPSSEQALRAAGVGMAMDSSSSKEGSHLQDMHGTRTGDNNEVIILDD